MRPLDATNVRRTLAALVLMLGSVGAADAKTIAVATNGLDAPDCGGKSGPCRTISKAIAIAAPNDKIVVGPGRYGDLDGDGTFNPNLGEETAEVGSGCFCMIHVDKPLDIESRDGAAATILDESDRSAAVVAISSGNVVLGRKKKGFTLAHGNLGVYVAPATNAVQVGGDLVTANGILGARIYGTGNTLSNDIFAGNGLTGVELNDHAHVVTDTEAIHNGDDASGIGFVLNGTGHQFSHDVASGNADTGFAIGGGGHRFTGNVASANGIGFHVGFGNGDVFMGNLVHGNQGDGFKVDGGIGQVITGNAIRGNGGFGIDLAAGVGASVTKNDIYGNGEGLRDDSGIATDATNNFWGASTGPGEDPADGILTGATSQPVFTPFATKEFKVKGATIR